MNIVADAVDADAAAGAVVDPIPPIPATVTAGPVSCTFPLFPPRYLSSYPRLTKFYSDTEKQVAHGWGGTSGEGEWADEKAGEAIAKEDEKAEGGPIDPDTVNAGEPAAEAEPEDKTKSYAEYLAEQAEKKLSLAAEKIRKANEGSSKKFPEGKALSKDDEEDAYIAGSGGKAKRERERKQKTIVELDDARLHSAPRESFGGRGRGRGRGEFRGGEGRGRGGRGRGEARGRGGRGGQSSAPTPNLTDSKAFPSLGA